MIFGMNVKSISKSKLNRKNKPYWSIYWDDIWDSYIGRYCKADRYVHKLIYLFNISSGLMPIVGYISIVLGKFRTMLLMYALNLKIYSVNSDTF